MQDDFFEEALGLHQDAQEEGNKAQADSKSKHVQGKLREKGRGFAKGRGMGNKVKLRR